MGRTAELKKGKKLMEKVSAFLDGGSSDPEIEISIDGSDLDDGLTLVQIDRGDSGTLAGLLLDEFQVGELISALQRRRHILPDDKGLTH